MNATTRMVTVTATVWILAAVGSLWLRRWLREGRVPERSAFRWSYAYRKTDPIGFWMHRSIFLICTLGFAAGAIFLSSYLPEAFSAECQAVTYPKDCGIE